MLTATRVRRVVIADDVADLRMLLRLALERTERFSVVGEAADGAEAVEQARAHRPDLVVLDLSMPRLDGLEALPLILDASPETIVVVLSGFDEARMGQAAVDAGATLYLEKGDILRVAARLDALT